MALCPHGQNPAACITCFHAKPKTQTQPQQKRANPPPQNPHTQGAPAGGVATNRPAPEAFGGEKIWEPPKHRSVIDSLPRRPPNLDK